MRNASWVSWGAWIALASSVSLPVQAGAPMATEDADVLGKNECEWESTYQRAKAGSLSINTIATKGGCGVFDGTQVALGLAHAKAEGESATGLGLSGKTALIARRDGGFGVTLAWGFSWAKSAGDSLRYESTALQLVASQGFGAFTVHGNVGAVKFRDGGDTVNTWALGGEYAVNDAVDLLAETFGSEGDKPNHGVGARFKASKDWVFGLMLSQGRSEPKVKSLLLSAKLAF